jgi:hypothetical protein
MKATELIVAMLWSFALVTIVFGKFAVIHTDSGRAGSGLMHWPWLDHNYLAVSACLGALGLLVAMGCIIKQKQK